MRTIRKIDFPRLWKMIDSNVNNNAWHDWEFFPVPIIFWDDSSNAGYNRHGFIVLPIQLHAPSKGGVCRFTVLTNDRHPDPEDRIQLAKYLQSNAYKKRSKPLTIYTQQELYQAMLDAIGQHEVINDTSRKLAQRMAEKYYRAILN